MYHKVFKNKGNDIKKSAFEKIEYILKKRVYYFLRHRYYPDYMYIETIMDVIKTAEKLLAKEEE